MKKIMNDIAAFKAAHDRALPDKLEIPDAKRTELLAKLIREEFRETMLAIYPFWDTSKEASPIAVDPVALADGLTDLVYVAVGMALECGLPLDKVWDEVHSSNMRKIGPDGNFVTREDGKILKPAGWVGPDIEGCLK